MLNKLVKFLRNKVKSLLRKFLNIKKIKLSGVFVELTHNDISYELKDFFYNESYEHDEIKILSKYLHKNDIVMEVGAGIGFLSTYCAKRVGSKNVFAYEANPSMIGKINETYMLNNVNPSITNAILSNKEEKVNFYLEKNFWSSSTVKRSHDSKCVQVESIDVNEEINKINPSFLIIDIEGGEQFLLPNIIFRCNSINKILIELHPHVIGEYESSKVLEFIIAQGFNLNFKEVYGTVFMFERNK